MAWSDDDTRPMFVSVLYRITDDRNSERGRGGVIGIYEDPGERRDADSRRATDGKKKY